MSRAFFLLSFFLSGYAWSDVFRIAEVKMQEAPEVERMIYPKGGKDEPLFVSKASILTVADIASATRSSSREQTISVKLTPQGAAKLRAATERMRLGVDRLAILIDGKINSAPVVTAVLGGQFDVSGFKELNDRDLENLARRMSGRPPLRADEKVPQLEKPPKVETVPYTEEEYRQLKKKLEEMGLFYLDVMPSEKELGTRLRKGMSHAEVLAEFGKPTRGPKEPSDSTYRLSYDVAAEKLPPNPDKDVIPVGFTVDFVDGKVTTWSPFWSNAQQQQKTPELSSRVLKATFPKVDLSDEKLDWVGFFEEIKIENPRQKITLGDLWDLVGIVDLTSKALEPNQKANVSADCDVLRILSHHLPEVEKLRQSATNGRIPIATLNETLSPYFNGEKLLPTPTDKILPSKSAPPAKKAK
jgi:hypothetical protein